MLYYWRQQLLKEFGHASFVNIPQPTEIFDNAAFLQVINFYYEFNY